VTWLPTRVSCKVGLSGNVPFQMPPPSATPARPVAVPVLFSTLEFWSVSSPMFKIAPPWRITEPVVVVAVTLFPLTRLSLIVVRGLAELTSAPAPAFAVPAGAVAVTLLPVNLLSLIAAAPLISPAPESANASAADEEGVVVPTRLSLIVASWRMTRPSAWSPPEKAVALPKVLAALTECVQGDRH
jgi:hypothetical protein